MSELEKNKQKSNKLKAWILKDALYSQFNEFEIKEHSRTEEAILSGYHYSQEGEFLGYLDVLFSGNRTIIRPFTDNPIYIAKVIKSLDLGINSINFGTHLN